MRGAALLALLLAVGCSRGSGRPLSSSPPPPTTSTLAPTTATLSPEEAVKAAYLAYWAVVDLVSNPNDPRLDAVATEPILSFDRDSIESDQNQGITTRLPADPALNSHRIDKIVIDRSAAAITDCFVDGRVAVAADGSIRDDDVVTKATEARLVLAEGQWKVSEVTFVERSPGMSGCAA